MEARRRVTAGAAEKPGSWGNRVASTRDGDNRAEKEDPGAGAEPPNPKVCGQTREEPKAQSGSSKSVIQWEMTNRQHRDEEGDIFRANAEKE